MVSWRLTTVDNSWQLLSIQVHQPMLYQSIPSETTVFTIDITKPKWRTRHGQQHKNCHSHHAIADGPQGCWLINSWFFPAVLIMFGFWFTSCYVFSIYSTYHDVSWIMALVLTCFCIYVSCFVSGGSSFGSPQAFRPVSAKDLERSWDPPTVASAQSQAGCSTLLILHSGGMNFGRDLVEHGNCCSMVFKHYLD